MKCQPSENYEEFLKKEKEKRTSKLSFQLLKSGFTLAVFVRKGMGSDRLVITYYLFCCLVLSLPSFSKFDFAY